MSEVIPRFPLQWPTGWARSTHRKRAQFSTKKNLPAGQAWGSKTLSVADGVERVMRELGAIDVREDDIVISTNIALRLDGFPRSGQGEPNDPGVAVYWRTGKGEARVMAVDIYDRVADNLAAIAASLDALRAIQRHGGGAVGNRAFTGFDALPPPKSPWAVLGISHPDAASEASVGVAYKAKVRTEHPDAPGGSHNKMAELNWARDEALRIIRNRTQ